MEQSNFIAADFGAGSGRVIIGTLCDNKIELKEIHRFDNKIIKKDEYLHWDLRYLFEELIKGLSIAASIDDLNISGIGIDTWGVDYTLLDSDDKLLIDPIVYRDDRTKGIMEELFNKYSKRKIYDSTGIQFLQFNTLYQIFSDLISNNNFVKKAERLLFMPDVFNFLLTGHKKVEYTIASTSQMLNAKTKKWDKEIFKQLDLSLNLMPEIILPGSLIGKLKAEIKNTTNLSDIDVIAVGSHDTASAIAAVPVQNNNWAYLSSGTWSLVGVEVPNPIINDSSYNDSFTNEGGIEGTIRYLKNTMGLWILEQTINRWNKDDEKINYEELFNLAIIEKPFVSIINPDDQLFLNPDNMVEAINTYCEKTNQTIPETKGQITRCILESLALKYKFIFDKIIKQMNNEIEVLHIIGGGSKNDLLNQYTSNAIGIKVIAGPVEATAIGNILMQAIATKKIKNLNEGRKIVSNSFNLKHYLPQDTDAWNIAYKKSKDFYKINPS